MVKRQYIDNTETMHKYAQFLSAHVKVKMVNRCSFEFDTTDEGRTYLNRMMDQINKDGCYGYSVGRKWGISRLRLQDLSILVTGLKQWCKTLIELDCLVVKEGEFKEESGYLKSMDETIRQAYTEWLTTADYVV